ncbi:PucR family transcriptional regulator [Nonomuraea sediminis]|uniref:PucR family transcriptional regulator n=1 Tax=Nonomuraea sediminis TaxID=2835864 RepID=UPI001BDC1C77|nr:PucR family transcriptional regulator [Nonomuraea sediminis]
MSLTIPLVQVLEELGATLLDLVAGDPRSAREVTGLTILDPHDHLAVSDGVLVLGVGVREPDEVVPLLQRIADGGGCALIVRAPVPVTAGIEAAAAETGVPLLGLTPGGSWVQLAGLVRSFLGEPEPPARDEPIGVRAGDLFAVANAVSALLDAPVTIEDRNLRVLAFSGRQDEADQSRVETILGRQMPERYLRLLEERGVFGQLYGSAGPVHFDLRIPGLLARAALAVRAGDEILGSIWATVRGPLTSTRQQAFAEVGKLVALHMLHHRARSDADRQLRSELVATALGSGPGASAASVRLGLGEGPSAVMAYALSSQWDAEQAARGEAARRRAADAFAVHLSAVHPRSASALIGDVVYGIMPVPSYGEEGARRAKRIAAEFLERIGERGRGAIGIGMPSAGEQGLAAPRADADRVLSVLRAEPGSRPVAGIDDLYIEVLLAELWQSVAPWGHRPDGPVDRLLAYDLAHGGRLVPTLRAWLDSFGDIPSAAAAVHVHPNTFRYRLRRLTEVGGIDLDDPEQRFAAMLILRLYECRS